MARASTRTCPTCAAVLTPILYGLRDVTDGEAAARGEIVLGGCTIGFDDPAFVCRGTVRHYWRPADHDTLVASAGWTTDV